MPAGDMVTSGAGGEAGASSSVAATETDRPRPHDLGHGRWPGGEGRGCDRAGGCPRTAGVPCGPRGRSCAPAGDRQKSMAMEACAGSPRALAYISQGLSSITLSSSAGSGPSGACLNV